MFFFFPLFNYGWRNGGKSSSYRTCYIFTQYCVMFGYINKKEEKKDQENYVLHRHMGIIMLPNQCIHTL